VTPPHPNDAVWYATAPAAYDIVTCWFPDDPREELRPCLVTNVYHSKSRADRFFVRVCFGTKNLKVLKRQHLDVLVQNRSDVQSFGLVVPTRFDLDYAQKLPWNDKFFGLWGGASRPVIGALREEYVKDYAYKMMLRRSA
jgi:hypothetical protein